MVAQNPPQQPSDEERFKASVEVFRRRCESNNTDAQRNGRRMPGILDWPRDEYFWYQAEKRRLERQAKLLGLSLEGELKGVIS